MKIKLRKKRLLLISSLLIVLILIFSSVIFFRNKIRAPYEKILLHCQEEVSNSNVTQTCKVFLNDFYVKDNNQACMKIVLPVLDTSQRDVEICFNSENIQWENPYEDYSYNIPIVMEMFYSSDVSLTLKPDRIVMKVMGDSDASALVTPINTQADEMIPYITESRYEKIQKGYYLTSAICLNGSEDCTAIGIYEVEVTDHYSDYENDEEVVLKVKMTLEGQEIEEEVRAKEFVYQEYKYGSAKPDITEFINANTFLDPYISSGRTFQIRCFLKEYEEFSEELIEKYANGDIELNFILTDLLYVKE